MSRNCRALIEFGAGIVFTLVTARCSAGNGGKGDSGMSMELGAMSVSLAVKDIKASKEVRTSRPGSDGAGF